MSAAHEKPPQFLALAPRRSFSHSISSDNHHPRQPHTLSLVAAINTFRHQSSLYNPHTTAYQKTNARIQSLRQDDHPHPLLLLRQGRSTRALCLWLTCADGISRLPPTFGSVTWLCSTRAWPMGELRLDLECALVTC